MDSGYWPPRADSMPDLFEHALAAHQQGRVTEAEAAYRAAINLNGAGTFNPATAAAAYNNLASLLLNRGVVTEAEYCWRTAIELSPGSADAHGNLATALLQQGRRRHAWQTLTRAVTLSPESSALYVKLGAVLTAGRPLSSLAPEAVRGAAAIARAALRLSPAQAVLWHNLGLALAASGQATRAGHLRPPPTQHEA